MSGARGRTAWWRSPTTPAGASVGGIYQLVGNVWEWTSSEFRLFQSDEDSEIAPLKGIRGGAFDTYFDNQATCQFEKRRVSPEPATQHRLPLRRRGLRTGAGAAGGRT